MAKQDSLTKDFITKKTSLLNRMSLLVKINLVVALTFLLVIVSVTTYTVHREKERVLEEAKTQTKDISTFYFDSLNTMMLTGTMDQRTVLRNKILRRPNIKVARVVRGNPVKQQFGEGYLEEQAVDELDRRALNGEEIVLIDQEKEGRIVTVLTPFRATENTRGVNCLQCHEVPSGSINGAIRISFSMADMDKRVSQQLMAEATANLLLLALGLILANLVLRKWITKPLDNLMAAVQQRAAGDITARATISSEDELGQLASAFNEMTENVNASVRREHEAAQEIRDKVDVLLDVVSRAARGDLTGQVRFGGDDAIGELAQVIQIMINNLRLLLKEKHDAVEDLQNKVDQILEVVTRAAEGDLTGKITLHGEDAIGRLAGGVQQMIDNLNALVAQVQHSGIQVTSSATEIAATAKQQAATMSQQAASVNEIVSTSAQISATAKALLETMNEVAALAEGTTNFATTGQAELNQMESTMEHIVEASSAIANKLEALREKAQNINTVVTTITKVADQTNLLSLNAAIEAEKAGEHGLGFAVVATEIRRLADQTAVASWDIEQMINKMQSAVTASVMGVEKFSEEIRQSVTEVGQVGVKLGQIIGQVKELTPRYESVHEGMQSQAKGAEQIKQAINSLNESAQQTVESLKHSKPAIDRLNGAAQGLQRGVSKFKVLTRPR
jgi:methyl-accepting chemotaxis protein